MPERVMPRYGTPRRSSRPTRGRIDAEVARLLGWEFFGWQHDAADIAGEYHPETRLPCYRTVGIGVARQNGKTTLVATRIARQLIVPRSTVAYTAQDRGIARTKWTEHVELLAATPFAERIDRIERATNREMLVMRNGSRYLPLTPSTNVTTRKRANAGRSLSIDLAVIDEAHAHETTAIVGAISPAMAARPAAQIWLLSNAGDADSGLWRHYTELGRAHIGDEHSTLCWIEYAAAPDADVLDRDAWAAANPSLDQPGGVTSAALVDAALTLDPDTFRREHLNAWTDSSEVSGIDIVTWAACRRDGLVPGIEIAVGLDVTPERDHGCLVAAGDVEGITPLEVIEHTTDLDHLSARAVEVASAIGAVVVIDRTSPAASMIPALERAGARLVLLSTSEAVRACGEFFDAAISRRLSHRGDPRLDDAVAAATKRRVGDSWTWQRRGAADISPLAAATWARWGIVTEAVSPLSELRIY